MAFDEARRDAFAERLFEMTIATLEAVSIYLGDRLGLYGALAEGGAQTSAELAARAGVTERYAREWLEQEAVAGLLDVDSTAAAADSRRYSISPEHAEVLTDRNSLAYMAPFPRLALSAAGRLPASRRPTDEAAAWPGTRTAPTRSRGSPTPTGRCSSDR